MGDFALVPVVVDLRNAWFDRLLSEVARARAARVDRRSVENPYRLLVARLGS